MPLLSLQWCSKYFETFWGLSKFSFHHKWNVVWLLVIDCYIGVTSPVPERLKILED